MTDIDWTGFPLAVRSAAEYCLERGAVLGKTTPARRFEAPLRDLASGTIVAPAWTKHSGSVSIYLNANVIHADRPRIDLHDVPDTDAVALRLAGFSLFDARWSWREPCPIRFEDLEIWSQA